MRSRSRVTVPHTVRRQRTVKVTESAEILRATRQRMSIIVRQSRFPKPVGRQGPIRLWDRREVVAWAKEWQKEKPWRSLAG